MTKEEVKNTLDQQLELLAEKSKAEVSYDALIRYTHAIAELVTVRLNYFKT